MTFELWSNTQLLDAIDSLMDRAERDDTLADPSFRDYFGALDAAIDSHIAFTDSMQSRAEVLDALMAEYGKRIAMAVAARWTFVGPCCQRRTSSGFVN